MKSRPDLESKNAIAADLSKASQHYERGDYKKAEALCNEVLAKEPDDPTALRIRGLCLVRMGQATEGLPLLARAYELAPVEPLAPLHYGIGLQATGRFAEAAEMFRAAIRLLPDNPAPPLNLASSLLDYGDVERARDAAKQAVSLAPNLAEAHYILGLAEMAARELKIARDEFEIAVRLGPRLVKAWVSLGLARYRLGDVLGAIAATNKALEIEPTNSAAEANLAAFLMLRGEQVEAIRRLRTLVARDPYYVPARVNLASQLIIDREWAEALDVLAGTPPHGPLGVHWRAQRVAALFAVGQRAEARAELDAIDGPLGDAEILIAWRRLLFALIDHNRDRAEEFAVRIETLADDEAGALPEHRVMAHFDLARFRNSRGERSRAIKHWRSGHKLLAAGQPFARDQYSALKTAIIESYDRGRLEDGPRANNRDITPLFIVGLPRSGTTLTEQILAVHPSVYGAGERFDIHLCLNRLAGPTNLAESIRKAANLDGPALSAAARKFLVDMHALAPGARYVADKMPGNALHLGFIATLLPRARVILCERDPRDIGLSIFQLRFFGYHPYAHDLGDLGWYIGQHQQLMAHWREVLPLPLLTVNLTDWVNDFSGTLSRVLNFLELPYDAACEKFYTHERKVRTASADQVRRPINSGGIDRWKAFAKDITPLIEELEAAGAISAQ